MQSTRSNLDRINHLAWLISVATARERIYPRSEYIWERPAQDFDGLRARAHAMFSGGNSIKDPTVMDFVQTVDIARHLKDPYITSKFEEAWPGWIQSSPEYCLRNLDLFRFTGFSQGTQEALINFYFVNRYRRWRVFKGEYWWHMHNWQRLGLQWAYLDDDAVRPGDVCICSIPFAKTGNMHHDLSWLIDTCEHLGVELLLDFVYLPNSARQEIDLDLSPQCIQTITFGLGKVFPIQSAKIAVRMQKTKSQDFMWTTNDENITNRLSSGLGMDILSRFPPDYMVRKYANMQIKWCDVLGLSPSTVVHLAQGSDYVGVGRDPDQRWYSEFNDQQGRYNLAVLFEHQDFLKPILDNPGLLEKNCESILSA